MIKNSDYKINELPPVTRPRPGHADLAGAVKYNQKDARNILERSSARETAARVAAGALVKILLSHFGIDVFGFVKGIGGINSDKIIKDMEVAKRTVIVVQYIALIEISRQKLLIRLNKQVKKEIHLVVLLKW